MARSLDEIENDLNALEAELEAMSGYEDQYPEHYQRLRDDWERVKREHNAALEVGQSLPPDDPPNVCIDPDVEESQSHYSNEECSVLPVAGIGDNICLIDPDPDNETDELTGLGSVQRFERSNVLVDAYTIVDDVNATWKISERDRKGGTTFHVSARIAEQLKTVVKEVHDAGGIVTSSGGFRPLGFPVTKGRIATSFHYSGLAVDLYTLTGTLDADHDRYVITRDGKMWRVYCRSDSQPEVTLTAVVFNPSTKMLEEKSCKGNFFDLTAIFERNGFERIPPQQGFRDKEHFSNQLQMEWWHFQVTTHLVSKKSKFGEVLLEIYTYKELKGSPPWNFRHAVWNGSSFKGSS